ncbi:hypothetical protein [Fluviicola taffensis]|uniref:Uncharacterized protein n=1 Tax=Fluviicola taffensis (strain DSM 16823 / NCIMB 13979 / RW262) TaxID=755732 RepID=F2IBL2_FLUTR|nr:hypothetical protein [Fluviicola taffensis]AEA45338.1 hypothetical protein Fluta_3366 [Fluviicola taffensis DSM 16823]
MIRNYSRYDKEKETNYLKSINCILLIENKAINKGYYRNLAIYHADKNNDQPLFEKLLLGVNLQDSFSLKNLTSRKYTHFQNEMTDFMKQITTSSKSSDSKILNILDSCYSLEQKHRIKIGSVYLKYRKNEITRNEFEKFSDSIFRLQNPLDEISSELFYRSMDTIGYVPGYRELNLEYIHMMFTIIQHLDNNEKKKRLIEDYLNQVKKNNLPSEYYVQIVDRYLESNNLPLQFLMTTKAQSGNPINSLSKKELKQININRLLFGLKPFTL